jgi:hypothetical protein
LTDDSKKDSLTLRIEGNKWENEKKVRVEEEFRGGENQYVTEVRHHHIEWAAYRPKIYFFLRQPDGEVNINGVQTLFMLIDGSRDCQRDKNDELQPTKNGCVYRKAQLQMSISGVQQCLIIAKDPRDQQFKLMRAPKPKSVINR